MKREQEKCRSSAGLSEILSEIFKTQHNEAINVLQYCKLIREQDEKVEEWMGCLRYKMNDCGYRQRQKTQRTIHKQYNDEEMIIEIITEPTAIKETTKVTSEEVLCWTKRVRVQTLQMAILEATKPTKKTKESKEFDALKNIVEQNCNTQKAERTRGTPQNRC